MSLSLSMSPRCRLSQSERKYSILLSLVSSWIHSGMDTWLKINQAHSLFHEFESWSKWQKVGALVVSLWRQQCRDDPLLSIIMSHVEKRTFPQSGWFYFSETWILWFEMCTDILSMRIKCLSIRGMAGWHSPAEDRLCGVIILRHPQHTSQYMKWE